MRSHTFTRLWIAVLRSVSGLVNMGLGSGCNLYIGLLPPLWLFLLSGIVSPYVLPAGLISGGGACDIQSSTLSGERK